MEERIIQFLIPAIGLISGLIGAYVGLQNRALLAEVRKELAEVEIRLIERINGKYVRSSECQLREPAHRGAARGVGGAAAATLSVLLGGDAVHARPVGALRGLDREPHLLAECARDEAAHAVGQPSGSGHDVRRASHPRAAGADRGPGLLAAVARSGVASLAVAPCRLGFLRRAGGRLGRGGRRQAWMAFQIRLTAVLRSVNFLIGLRPSKGTTPAKAFQTSAKRAMGHSEESLANSFSVPKRSGLREPARRGRRP